MCLDWVLAPILEASGERPPGPLGGHLCGGTAVTSWRAELLRFILLKANVSLGPPTKCVCSFCCLHLCCKKDLNPQAYRESMASHWHSQGINSTAVMRKILILMILIWGSPEKVTNYEQCREDLPEVCPLITIITTNKKENWIQGVMYWGYHNKIP